MQRLLIPLCSITLAACAASSDATSPLGNDARASTNLSTTLAGTYVLSTMGPLTSAPFVMFDRMCGDSHDTRLRQVLLGDTVVLRTDGSARRGFTLGMYTNDVTDWENHDTFGGTWAQFDATNYYYFGGHQSIVVSEILTSSTGVVSNVDLRLRVEADGSLTTPSGIGGSCVGSPEAHYQDIVEVYRKI